MSRWLRFFSPSPGPAALAGGTGGVIVLGLLISVGYGVGGPAGEFGENFGFLMGLFVAPLAVLLLFAAAVWEKRPLPRAGLWGAAAGALAVGGLFTVLGLAASPEIDLTGGLALYSCTCLPGAGLLTLPGVYFLFKGLPEAQAAVRDERAEQALRMLQARGEVTVAELATELGVPPTDGVAIVERLLQQERFVGLLDAPRGRVYTHAALRARQQQLVAVVHARGQVTFDDLAAELRAPRELLRQWVYEAVKRGEFTGYLNWTDGLLYSADADKLRAAGRCPRCGGELGLAGQGVVQCTHCGSEIFV